jgi:cytochrome c oxidase subunit 3
LIGGDVLGSLDRLLCSILLGIMFLSCQYFEYINSEFSMSSGVFGSNFFGLTGFHGFHVSMRCSGLVLCYVRSLFGDVFYRKGVRHECII